MDLNRMADLANDVSLHWLIPLAAVFLLVSLFVFWRIDKDWGG